MRITVKDLISAIVQTCDDATLAGILNAFIDGDANESLNDFQVAAASKLFDAIVEAKPRIIDLAVTGSTL